MPEDEQKDPLPPRDPRTLGLIECIALAQATFGSLPKDGHAIIASDKGRYEYDYITEGALMARVREILSPMGVAVLPSVTDVEHRQGGSVWITVAVTFAKGEERETVTGRAEGVDPRDKAYNKAITTAVRLVLTKTFLQGGDVDPEQTVNERTTPLPGASRKTKLSEARIGLIIDAAKKNGIVEQDGRTVDQKMLLRLASYTCGEKVTRIDEIPGQWVDKLVDVMIPGYAANQSVALDKIVEMEIDRGW